MLSVLSNTSSVYLSRLSYSSAGCLGERVHRASQRKRDNKQCVSVHIDVISLRWILYLRLLFVVEFQRSAAAVARYRSRHRRGSVNCRNPTALRPGSLSITTPGLGIHRRIKMVKSTKDISGRATFCYIRRSIASSRSPSSYGKVSRSPGTPTESSPSSIVTAHNLPIPSLLHISGSNL